MQLTTPELKKYDSVFPGENWFFYWKTSPSLWESKIQSYNDVSPIFVPVYWGLHNENPEQFDFGTNRPETDLKRILDIAQNCRKEIVLILPLGPSPFFTSGGLPSFLAQSLAHDSTGKVLAVVDNEKRINKLFSYYDPRVFQAFRKFTWHLGQFLSQNGFNKELFGADFGYLENNDFKSYFEDYSGAFLKGFHRYLAQLEKSEPQKIENLISTPAYENVLKNDYAKLIKSLYIDSAKETIAANWSGALRFCCLGGKPNDIFSRSHEKWEVQGHYIRTLFEILVNGLLPSSFLLPESVRTNVLQKALKDVVSQSLVQAHLNNELYDEELHTSFQPQVFFKVFSKNSTMEEVSLKYFFDREYQWMYRIFSQDFHYEQDYEDIEKVHFFFGEKLELTEFNQILKLFLNGGRVFLDKHKLSPELSKRLNLFLTENSIETESINYLTPLLKASLGDGLLIAYDSEKLKEQSLVKRVGFWETMTKFLKLNTCALDIDEGIMYIWKNRCSNTYELNYEEIRRISFYNPTSYKKKATIRSSQNYAYLKTLDEVSVEVRSTPVGIDIDLMPGASVSIDFGYFE